LWRTSPLRYQGLWLWNEPERPIKAEAYSQALAYRFGGDANGWSITKMLRIPGSLNHKPEYTKPKVELVHCKWKSISDRPRLSNQRLRRGKEALLHLRVEKYELDKVWRRYRSKLHPRVSALIRVRRAYAFERDRSKCIFEIIAGLNQAGATPDEIGAVLWSNPYFLSKHGRNLDRLHAEVSRVLSKLEAVK
jgi:hypothetical protein